MPSGRFEVDTTNIRQELRGIKNELRALIDRVDVVLEAVKTSSVNFVPDPEPPTPPI